MFKFLISNKIRKFFLLGLSLLLCMSMTACKSAYQGNKNYEENTFLLAIPGSQDLYYDPDEKIVYIIFSEASGYKGYGYMSPYYSQNGLPYLYDSKTKSLIEIENK